MRSLRNLWLAGGWLGAALIVYLSLVPSPPQPVHFDYSDKAEHALAYGLVMLWFSQLFRQRARLVVGGLLIALGVLMEILQGMSGYRTFEYADMLADSVGVVLAWGLAHTAMGRIYQRIETCKQPLNEIP